MQCIYIESHCQYRIGPALFSVDFHCCEKTPNLNRLPNCCFMVNTAARRLIGPFYRQSFPNTLSTVCLQQMVLWDKSHQSHDAPVAIPPFLLPQVESNPFPFNYVANYTVSTKVVSMEFRTENGTHIPISGLNDSLAITVAVSNFTNGGAGSETASEGSGGVGGVPVGGAVNISQCESVIVRVSAGNSNRQAGLSVQLNFTVLEGETS